MAVGSAIKVVKIHTLSTKYVSARNGTVTWFPNRYSTKIELSMVTNNHIYFTLFKIIVGSFNKHSLLIDMKIHEYRQQKKEEDAFKD